MAFDKKMRVGGHVLFSLSNVFTANNGTTKKLGIFRTKPDH